MVVLHARNLGVTTFRKFMIMQPVVVLHSKNYAQYVLHTYKLNTLNCLSIETLQIRVSIEKENRASGDVAFVVEILTL